MKRVAFSLARSAVQTTYLLGVVNLPVVLGEGQKSIKIDVPFRVVDALRPKTPFLFGLLLTLTIS